MRAELLFGSQTRRHTATRPLAFFPFLAFAASLQPQEAAVMDAVSMNHSGPMVLLPPRLQQRPPPSWTHLLRESNAAAVPQPARRSAVTATAPQRFAKSPPALVGGAGLLQQRKCLCLAFRCGQHSILRMSAGIVNSWHKVACT